MNEIDEAMNGLPFEAYATAAKGFSKRLLLCVLRDARKRLAHHGRRSFMGREARKEIEAVVAELGNRGMEAPPEGRETEQWDRK
jgi:hypothetical protein